jgi:hypothetical protein
VLRTPAGSTLAPLAPVSAIISVSDADGFYVAYQYVSSDGSYVVPSLTAGTYHAVVTGDVFDEAYGGIDCVPQCDPDAGTPIVLAQGQNASNVDFNPISRLYIFGRVTEAGGAPVPHVAIDLWRDDDGAHCGATTTNADGYYGISSTLDSCPYDHWLSTDVPLPWVNQVYDGIVCPNGSVWLGLCSLDGGTGVPFPTSPGFVIANFPLGARVDAILANGFDP